jgi:hypothetical protein
MTQEPLATLSGLERHRQSRWRARKINDSLSRTSFEDFFSGFWSGELVFEFGHQSGNLAERRVYLN